MTYSTGCERDNDDDMDNDVYVYGSMDVPSINCIKKGLRWYVLYIVYVCLDANLLIMLLPKYQPKRGGDLGWSKLFRFKCGIKNYFQLAKTNLRTQFNCNKIW